VTFRDGCLLPAVEVLCPTLQLAVGGGSIKRIVPGFFTTKIY
jgi:hypothetical protein